MAKRKQKKELFFDTLEPGVRKELEKACTVYKGFKWGREPEEILLIKDVVPIPETVVVLGELTGVTYRTIKGKDGQMTLYVHSFDEDLPLLCCDPGSKQLYILGGRYTIEDRGIVH